MRQARKGGIIGVGRKRRIADSHSCLVPRKAVWIHRGQAMVWMSLKTPLPRDRQCTDWDNPVGGTLVKPAWTAMRF